MSSVLNQYQFSDPDDYYKQPSLRLKRPDNALSEDEHMNLLGDKLGGRASIQSVGGSHTITVQHYGDGSSWMTWQGRRKSRYHRSGEIHMVSSAQKGAASEIHDAARAIARDTPQVSVPKHSTERTLEGAWWVHKEQLRHGEQLWGNPDLEGSPAHLAWLQFQGYLSENDDDVDRSNW